MCSLPLPTVVGQCQAAWQKADPQLLAKPWHLGAHPRRSTLYRSIVQSFRATFERQKGSEQDGTLGPKLRGNLALGSYTARTYVPGQLSSRVRSCFGSVQAHIRAETANRLLSPESPTLLPAAILPLVECLLSKCPRRSQGW